MDSFKGNNLKFILIMITIETNVPLFDNKRQKFSEKLLLYFFFVLVIRKLGQQIVFHFFVSALFFFFKSHSTWVSQRIMLASIIKSASIES